MTIFIPTRTGMRAAIAVATLTAFAAFARPALPQAALDQQLAAAPFERAREAFISHDFAGAEAAYRAVLHSDTVSAHHREAAVMLAAIAWRVRRDTAAAVQLLTQAEATDWGRFAAAKERSRMLRAWGDFPAARAAANAALAAAATQAERDSATTSWAAAAITPLLRHRLAEEPGTGGSAQATDGGTAADAALLHETISRLDTVVRRAPGMLVPSRLLVLAGALSLDARALLTGWRSYYLVEVGDSVHGLLAAPRRTLEDLGAAGGESHAAIVRALAASRFFQAAAAVALLPDSSGTTLAAHDARARAVVAYASFLRSVTHATNEFYRKTALGTGSKAAWTAALDSAARVLWPALGNSGPAPRFADQRLAAELDRRFGALVNVGRSAGYDDLHMGHRVVDVRRRIQQYGHTATVRFVALDEMASNGFQSWAWDGRMQHGGWGDESLIVQVRPRYAEVPFDAWHEVTDPALVQRRARRIAEDSVADIARARTTPVTHFPSVAERLKRDGQLAVLDSLRRAGYQGAGLETAFERAIGAAVVESSIFAHEGRHSIDHGLGLEGAPVLEYRAKLSEVAFAPEPRLAFGGIMNANVGDDTPHGQANLRMLKGLLGWMESHAAEIRGLDRSVPFLPQLPLLSDAQLRLAAASLDPLARGRAGSARAPARTLPVRP